MEVRKVQVVGGTTFIVSLPKKWVREAGLKPGGELILIPKGSSSLLIKLKESPEKTDSTININVNSGDKGDILRLIIASYLAGYQNMKITSDSHIDPNIEQFIRNNSWKFMGFEIAEESQRELILTTLFNSSAITVNNGLTRMLKMVSTMHRNAIKAFIDADKRLAEDTIKFDDEVDRLNLFIIRQLMLVQGSLMTTDIGINMLEESLIYRSIVKDLEKIGDYAAEIAKKTSPKHKLPEPFQKEVNDLSELVIETYNRALEAFLANNLEATGRVYENEERFNRKRENILRQAEKALDPTSLIKITQILDILHEIMTRSRSIINETFNRYIITQNRT